MSVRNTQPRDYAYRFSLAGRNHDARFIISRDESVFLRVPVEVQVDTAVELDWAGPGGIRVEGVCVQLGPEAPDGWFTCQVRVRRVAARQSPEALRWYLRSALDRSLNDRPEQLGGFWFVALSEDGRPAPPAEPKSTTGPRQRIAGQRADMEPAPPLDTGYPATTPEHLVELLERFESKVGVYLSVPCAYIVAGAAYWGRALRMNERWLQVNTNTVVPGLGVRMRADLTLEIDGVKRAVSVSGVMSRKKDLPPGGAYKATLGLMIRQIDEGTSPGLLRLWLERHMEARRSRDEAKRPPE